MLQLMPYATLVAATLVLLLGRLLVNKMDPAHFQHPQTGGRRPGGRPGAAGARSTLDELQFDTSLQTP